MKGIMQEKLIVAAVALCFLGMAFGGMSGLAFENETVTERTFELHHRAAHNIPLTPPKLMVDEKTIPDVDTTGIMAEPGTEPLAQGLVFNDGFETYPVDQPLPDDPWYSLMTTDTDFAWEETFETSTLGEHPDTAVWNTVDGAWDGIIFHEDWEDYNLTQPPQPPKWWANVNGGANIGAIASPGGANAPPGSTQGMEFREVPGQADSVISTDTGQFGPAPAEFTTVMIEFWGYSGPRQTNDADMHVYLWSEEGPIAIPTAFYSEAYGAGTAAFVWWYDGDVGHTEIYNDMWVHVEIEYYTTTSTFRIRINGGAWNGPHLFYGGTEATRVGTLQIYGGNPDYPTNQILGDVKHFVPVTGSSEFIEVNNAWSASGYDGGTQSLLMDQNNEANMAHSTATFPAAFFGETIYMWFIAKTDTVANSHGATFYGVDYMQTAFFGIRFFNDNIQYFTNGSWVNIMTFDADTEYFFEFGYNDITRRYTDIYINFVPYISDQPLGNENAAGLKQFRMQGTPGTRSRIWVDFIGVYATGADASLTVVDTVARSGTQSVHFLERGGDDYSVFGVGFEGGVGSSEGALSFWFYVNEPQGGIEVYLWDSSGSNLMTLISFGTDIGAGPHPWTVQFVDNDGEGAWIRHGPAFSANTWHKVSIVYNCTASTFTALFDESPVGTFGMFHPALDLTYAEFYGGAPDMPADYYIDDVQLIAELPPVPPAAPADLTVDQYGELPAQPGPQTVQTRYMRADNVLGTTQSATAQSSTDTVGVRSADVRWGMRAWAGSTELTGGTPEAQVARLGNTGGEGLQNTNWACPGHALSTTHTVTVRVYMQIDNGNWNEVAAFITEQLGAVSLDAATWTVNYYTERVLEGGGTPSTTGTFHWGIDTRDSRIAGFTFSEEGEPAAPPSTEHNTLNWTHDGIALEEFRIYRSDVSTGPWDVTTLIATVPPGTNKYMDEDMGTADAIYWWYVVSAYNEYGENSTAPVQEPGDIVVPDPYDIDLSDHIVGDWVFVSFPIAISGNIHEILDDPGTTWDVAKWYDGIAKTWVTYRPGYTSTFAIDNTMGVWLHLTSITGSKLTTAEVGEFPTVSVNIHLYAGWNMVGYPSGTNRTASLTLPAEANIVSVWQAATPYISDQDPTFVTMSHGNAYWVHVTADTLWTVDP